MRVDDIAAQAIEIKDADERATFVASVCENEEQLQQVNALLAALEQADKESFLSAGILRSDVFRDDAGAATSSTNVSDRPNRFEIRSKHAVGGLGEVYLAWDRELAREVALKQMRPEWEGDQGAAARFRREAEITGFLEHPGVVPVYSLGGLEVDRPFYAMQFIRGRTLHEVVEEEIGLVSGDPNVELLTDDRSQFDRRWYSTDSLRQLLNQFVAVCQTIDYAHSKNVIHRDLKPSNIMLGAYGQTLLVDWGLAKRIDTKGSDDSTNSTPNVAGSNPTANSSFPESDSSVDSTRQGTTLGTPRFMSPEQASGEIDQVGPATDIYCLGATLYFVLTGRAPHVGEADLESTLRRIRRGEFQPPSKVRAEIPKPLVAIVMKAMATRADMRYASAGALAKDIDHFLGDSPVSVFKDPPHEQLRRWTRKHRAVSASAAVGLFLVFLGTIIGLITRQSIAQRELEVARQQESDRQAIEREKVTRQLEAKSAAEAAQVRAEVAIDESRFGDAAALINVAVDQLTEIDSMQSQRMALIEKRIRLERLGRFVSLKQSGEDLDHLARDTEAAVLLQESLQQLGVWQSNTWWRELPDSDLTELQRHRLRWQVYRILTVLNSIYLTKMVAVMGGETSGGTPSAFRMLRSFISTNIGKREAEAVVELTKRIEQFRPGQAARWLGGLARYRLSSGRRIEPKELGPPENPSDGQSLAIFSLIASVDPSYRVWFNDYGDTFVNRGDETPSERARLVALETLRRVSDAAPNDYWIRLTLAQTYFVIARHAEEQNRFPIAIEHYELSRSEYGRCIAIRQEIPFAHADRSTVALRHAMLLLRDPMSTENDRKRADELLRVSVSDANQAKRLHPDADWVYWHVGATATMLNQVDIATDSFFKATELGFEVQENTDAPMVRLDDLRGRELALEFAYQDAPSIESLKSPDDAASKRACLIAALEYSRGKIEPAFKWAQIACRLNEQSGRGHRIAGWCWFRMGDLDQARIHFESALGELPDDPITLIGAARVEEQQTSVDSKKADLYFQRATETAVSSRHRSAAWFGLAKQAVRRGHYDVAIQAVQSARELDPACDVIQFVQLSRSEARRLLILSKASKNSAAKDALLARIKRLKQFMDRVSVLPAASVNQILSSSNERPPDALPLFGGDFQLPLELNWQFEPSDPVDVQRHERIGGSPPWSIEQKPGHQDDERCLVIRRFESDQSTSTWSLVQRLPATSGHSYRVSIDVRSQHAKEQTVCLLIRRAGETLVRFPLDLRDPNWNTQIYEVSIPPSRNPIESIDFVLEVQDPADGTVMLDNIDVVCEKPDAG